MRYLLLIWMIYLDRPLYVLAQESTGTLRGLVKDAQGKPLAGLSVHLLSTSDSTAKRSQQTGADGVFLFEHLPNGSQYRVQVLGIGYAPYEGPWFLMKGKVMELAPILLQEAIQQLEEVQIQGKEDVFRLESGKLTYQVENSPSASGSTALDLLRRMPGVAVDQNDQILLKGSASVNVLLDGKMTYMSPAQLANLLRSMPSDNLSKIEVMQNPSAAYDAVGVGGVINIVSKKAKSAGYAADWSSGLIVAHDVLHRHQLTGSLRAGKVQLYTTLGYSDQRRFTEETSELNRDLGERNLNILREGINANRSDFYTYKLNMDVQVHPKHQLGFGFNGTTDDWRKEGYTNTRINRDGAPEELYSQVYSKEPYYTHTWNLHHVYTLDSMGKSWHTDLNYINYRNFSDGYINELLLHQPTFIHIWSGQSDWNLPYSWGTLKTGIKYAHTDLDNQLEYRIAEGQEPGLLPENTDRFQYKERIAAAYLSFSKEWKQVRLEAGLRVEHTGIDLRSQASALQREIDYTNVFPSILLRHNLSEQSALEFSLGRRINRPAYTSLNPARYYTDPYTYYVGNPELVPEKAWLANLSYTLDDRYIFSFNYSRGEDIIARSVQLEEGSNLLINSNANFAYRNRYELQAIAPYQLASWWNTNLSLTLSRTRYPIGRAEEEQLLSRNTVDLAFTQQLDLPGKLALEVMTHYTSPELNGNYLLNYFFSLDGGLRRSFFKEKLSATFSFSDLLHTNWYWGRSVNNLFGYTYKNTPDTRRFSFTLRYHIGGKLGQGADHRTEEQNRL